MTPTYTPGYTLRMFELVAAGVLSGAGAEWAFRRGHLLRFSGGFLAVILCFAGLVAGTCRPAFAATSCTNKAFSPTGTDTPGVTISDSEIAKVVAGAFKSEGTGTIETAVAVAMSEGGNRPCVVNPIGASGLFQFMPYTWPGYSSSGMDALNPIDSANAAFKLWQARQWEPWESYTNGEYGRNVNRAAAALKQAAGCDFMGDPTCPPILLAAAVASVPVAVSSAGSSALPSLPGLDPQKMIYQAIAGGLWHLDHMIVGEIENVWNPLVTGTDDLNGRMTLGPGLVVDNTKLKTAWALSLGICLGSLLVLIFTIMVVSWMFQSMVGSPHDMKRMLVWFFTSVILMGGSFFLVTQLIDIDNALTWTVGQQTALELRALPSYQGLGIQDPSGISDVDKLLDAIGLLLIGLFIAAELILLFIVYFIRLILLWTLVVMAPFAFASSSLPGGFGVLVFWARLLIATIFVKFVNALIFMLFIWMGATSQAGIFNELFVLTMLLFMLLVPKTTWSALSEPGYGVGRVQEMWRQTTHQTPLRFAYAAAGRKARDVGGWFALPSARWGGK